MKRPTAFIIVLLLFFYPSIFAQSKDQLLDIKPLPGIMDDVRSMEKTTNLERLESIKTMLESRNISYEIESFTIKRRKSYPRNEGQNVIVTIGTAEKDILIGGHWDAPFLRDGTLCKGVIDNGNSAVVLVRLAEALKTIRLNHIITGVINLDVLGYGTTFMFGPRNNAGNNLIYRTFKAACVDLDYFFTEFPEYPGSDDRSFQRAGIANISIGTAPAVDALHMWLSLNGGQECLKEGVVPGIFTHIHSKEDKSSNVDPRSLTIVYNALLETVKRLDKKYN